MAYVNQRQMFYWSGHWRRDDLCSRLI